MGDGPESSSHVRTSEDKNALKRLVLLCGGQSKDPREPPQVTTTRPRSGWGVTSW
jgi:hypothetical protein